MGRRGKLESIATGREKEAEPSSRALLSLSLVAVGFTNLVVRCAELMERVTELRVRDQLKS